VDEPSPHAHVNGTRRTVALVGPDPSSKGGIAATMRAIAGSPELAERYRFVTIPTYADGSRPAKLGRFAVGLARLARGMARGELDLVHVHTASGASFVRKCAALALVRGRPLVLHVHGGGFARKLSASGHRAAAYRRAMRWAIERADAVVALSDSWADEVARWGTPRRLAVVPNVPDLPAALNGSLPAERPPYLLYLGHLHRKKGLFELLDAYADLRDEHPGLRLVVAGESTRADGVGGRALLAHARERGAEAGLQLTGWVDGSRKAQLLRGCACFVLPSHVEGLPLAVVEAMTAGRPVVATTVGGVPELVRDGVDGLLVPPRDPAALTTALRRVLGDPSFASRLAESARRRAAAQYAPGAAARTLGALYDELLGAS
jgi:glycosyltransferase involved in cell wall biosynthesis